MDRFLVDGRIATYPRRTAVRRVLLEHVVAGALTVDHGLLVRTPDGGLYFRP